MSFREKSAVLHIVAFVFLLTYMISSSARWPALDPASIPVKHLWIAIILFIAIEAIGHGLLAAFNKREANQSLDERDKLVEYKSSHFSGLLLSGLIIFYICGSLLLGIPVLSLANVLSILVIAEILHYSLQLLFYRRGL
ncbi:hypothetical protein [Kangiella sp. TOML190]|uniref:hypothetical protein n=1 Tax=Kangiella sp. TOML190 TaxID=2931351 RepID=UPI00203E9FA5|nr:hypothetical protein [Kangiella sp. TOML190]